jgi:3-hydroxyacyl-[acyl-carrier-protein] dehydratase
MRFVLIDRITSLEPGVMAEGYKRVAPDEEYFRDHFPGYPVVPGVLVLESLAQLGGRLVEASVIKASGRRVLPMLAKVELGKFLRPVKPGDRLDLRVELVALGDDAARVKAVARVEGRRSATADIMYAMIDVDRPGGPLNEAQTNALHEWSDRVWRELTGEQ